MASIGSVAELRRYPVKSLVGEVVTSAEVDTRGLVGDRRWAVRDPDGKLGSGKSTRRFRRMHGLLDLSAEYGAGPVPLIIFPDGRRLSADDPRIHHALSGHVQRQVRLLPEGDVSHFDEGPLHLVTTASLTALSEAHGRPVSTARLRSNLLIDVPALDGLVEDCWIGRALSIGADLVVRIREPMIRCVMLNLPQRGLPSDDGLLDCVATLNNVTFGVVADVLSPGIVHLDDPVALAT